VNDRCDPATRSAVSLSSGGDVDEDFVAYDVGWFAVGRRNHELVWGESKPFDGFPGKEPLIDRHDSLQRVMRCDMLKVSGAFG